MSEVFKKLSQIDVSKYIESKNGLNYLSWASAWQELCKVYPDSSYKVFKDENGKPYIYDENLGYMCMVELTVDGMTREMWLPVMDGANRPMKAQPYVIKTKYKDTTVAAAGMTDINKTIMRCLVKAIGMFGLGLYIYKGEDLPEVIKEPMSAEHLSEIKAALKEVGVSEKDFLAKSKRKALTDLFESEYEGAMNFIKYKLGAKDGQ